MKRATSSDPTVRGWLRTASIVVLVVGVWISGAWQTWSRTAQVKSELNMIEDIAVYDSIRPEFDGVEEVWILVERSSVRRLRKRTGGQAQRAQYALAPTVVYRVTSPRVAAFTVRAMTKTTCILHFFVTDEHFKEVNALLEETAQSRDLVLSGHPVSNHLFFYRIEMTP